MVKIYTKTGDRGEAGLFDGSRVPKHAPRVMAYGDIDEPNAIIGMALAFIREDAELRECLLSVQRELFAVLLFVAARLENLRCQRPENPW